MLCWGEVVVDEVEGVVLREKPEPPEELVALVVPEVPVDTEELVLVATVEPVLVVAVEPELPVVVDVAVVPVLADDDAELMMRPTVLAAPTTPPTAPAVLSTLPTVPEAPAILPMVLPTPVTAPTVLPTL